MKRRFRNTPGHAMYFNRTVSRKGDKAYAWPPGPRRQMQKDP